MAVSKLLRVSPDSELSQLLRDALESGGSMVVDTGEVVYRLNVASTEPELAEVRRPSPSEIENSRAGIRRAFGSWRDIDAEEFKAYIRARRRTVSTERLL